MRPCCSALVLAIAHQIASIPTTCQSQNFKNLGRDLQKGSALENLFFKANQGTWAFSPREDVLKMEKKRRLFPFKFIHKKGINLLKFIFFLKTFSSERYAIHVTVEQEGVLRYMVEKMGAELSREDGTEREIIITGEDSQPERESEAKQEEGHPHEHQSILGTTDAPPPIHDQLYAGVFLNNRTMKHWVEKESKKNCFMIYARGLSITWAKNNSYWQWLTQKDAPSDDAPVEMAELLNVCWLDVHDRFDVSKLSLGTTYEVAFVILMRSSGYGWQIPVNFRLTLPDGTKQEHKENLKEKPRGDWIEIKAGELSTSKHKEGEMEVYMFEHGGHWKSGLVLKGVLIRPKN